MKNTCIGLFFGLLGASPMSYAQDIHPSSGTVQLSDSLELLQQARREFWASHHILDGTNQVAPSEILQQGYQMAQNQMALDHRGSDYFWCSQGPDNFSGNIQVLLIDKTNENHMYAGAERGGLFESFDNGTHWNPVANWDKHMFISALAQGSDGTIYVGTGQKLSYSVSDNIGGAGVYYMNPNDPAAEWLQVPGTNSWNVQSIATNEVNTKLFIGSHNGLFSWDKDQGGAPQSATSNSNACHEVKVSSNGQVVLCRFGTSPAIGLLVSQDSGATFTSLFGNSADGLIPPGSAIFCKFGISKNPVNGTYVCYIVGRTIDFVTTFRSEDNGLTWKQVAVLGQQEIGNYNNNFYAACLWVNPTNPNQLIMGTGNAFLGTYNPNSEFLAWEQLSTLVADPSEGLYLSEGQFDIQVNSQNKIYIATYGGLYISQDFGASFQRSGYNLHNTVIHGLGSGGDGRMLAGTLYHGALINTLTNATPKSFSSVHNMDYFDAAISTFNTNMGFAAYIYGGLHRVISNGSQHVYETFTPNYVGYEFPGSPTSGSHFHFRTSLALAEYYDPNSKDSVSYLPTSFTPTGTTISVASLTTGKVIAHSTTQPLYFDALVNHDPNLTILDYLITNANTGAVYELYTLTWDFLVGSGEPEVGDVILVSAPFEEIIEIGAVSTYNRYFAQHPITGKILDMGANTPMTNVAWDTLRIADPYQSIFVTHTRKNGGELYATRDALRTAQTPKWSKIVEGIGEMFTGEIAISSNLEHIYVGTSTGLWRVDGFADAYSTQEDFASNTDLRIGAAPLISKTQLHNEGVTGISINPNYAGDVLIALSGIGTSSKLKRSAVANTAAGVGSFQSVFGNLPTNLAYYDALIDVYDANKLLVANTFGVWSSDDVGTTWSSANAGMGSVSVSRIIQNWRINDPNTTKPGEIYLATLGSGIFSTGECTDFAAISIFDMDNAQFDLLIYPNPSSDKTTLQITSSQAGQVQINVFSISGIQIAAQNTFVEAGLHEIEFRTSEFKSGLYIVQLSLGNAQLTRKLMKF